MTPLNRMIEVPSANSRAMRAYMQAILEVTGLAAGQMFPMELFMKNYKTHLEPKSNYPHPTMLKNAGGIYQLTPEGQYYFSSRLTQDPVVTGQKVSRSEVVEMIRAIVAPTVPDGWESFEVWLPENA